MRGCEQIPWLYDALCTVCEATGFKRWRQWLATGARGRTLDLGCGTGRNLPLFPSGVRAVGVDPERASLRRARRRSRGTPLVQARAEALPFRDGVFDTVVTGLVFCSVSDPMRGLAEVKRVLAPNGTLRMLEHVRSTKPWKARFQDWIQPAWTRASGGCHPNRDTERTVTAAGFAIDERTRRAKADMRRFEARPARGGEYNRS